MKTQVLVLITLLCAGMIMTSCQKEELVSPLDVNKDPDAPGENYVPSQFEAAENQSASGTVAIKEQIVIDESTIGYFNISQKRFDQATNIEFEVLKPSYVSLMIFDANGNQVRHPISKLLKKGVQSAEFDASELPEGVYTIRLWARHIEFVEKVEKIKYTSGDS